MNVAAAITLALVAAFFAFRSSNQPDTKEISDQFRSYVSAARSTQKIVLYELQVVEQIDRTEKHTLLWNLISLPDLVIRMQVPVQYGFYVDVSEGFEFQKDNGNWIVIAPPLRSQTPAVDISGLSFHVRKGAFFHDTQNAKEAIQRDLTEYLFKQSEKAKSSYETQAAESLKGLVGAWLRQSNPTLPNEQIQVRFRNQSDNTRAP